MHGSKCRFFFLSFDGVGRADMAAGLKTSSFLLLLTMHATQFSNEAKTRAKMNKRDDKQLIMSEQCKGRPSIKIAKCHASRQKVATLLQAQVPLDWVRAHKTSQFLSSWRTLINIGLGVELVIIKVIVVLSVSGTNQKFPRILASAVHAAQTLVQ